MEQICYNCFSNRGKYEVCPYCGFANIESGENGYVLKPGCKIWGRYIIGKVLGMGGFGITYKAYDIRLSNIVAIKEFFPQSLVSRIPGEQKVRVFSGEKQESYKNHLAKFMEEARNLAKFTGEEHIVNVLDFFEENGTAYIIMEFLDGITLKQHLVNSGGKLPVEKAVQYETELLKALSAIHNKGIIHRDISPDNIYILANGNLKVLDFGAARFALEEGSDLSQSVVVKKGYAPPEQYRKNMKQGKWTDIYAAGATLYKMITGQTPEESIERAEKDSLKRPSQTGIALDAAVDKTVMKSMALKPELRFKNAEDMLNSLLNKTKYDYPEEELKKAKKRNAAIVFASIAIVLAVALGIAFSNLDSSIPVQNGDSENTSLNNGGAVENDSTNENAQNEQETPPEEEKELIEIRETPPLDFSEIQPCEISVSTYYVYYYDEEIYENVLIENIAFQNLEAAFEAKYPQIDLTVEYLEYEQTNETEFQQRFLTEDATTVFIASGLSQIDDPHKADLTPLYNTLTLDDYYALEEDALYILNNSSYAYGNLHSVPMSFSTKMLAYNPKLVNEENGYILPDTISGYEEIIAFAKEYPGTLSIDVFELLQYLSNYEREIYENKDYETYKNYLTEYHELINNYTMSTHEYFSKMILCDAHTSSLAEHFAETNITSAIPILSSEGNNQIIAYTRYSVSPFVSENEQLAGMALLHFMLSEEGQKIIVTDNIESSGAPLLKTLLPEYTQKYPIVSFMSEDSFSPQYINYTMDLYIDGLQELYNANSSLPSIEEIMELYDEQFGYWKEYS